MTYKNNMLIKKSLKKNNLTLFNSLFFLLFFMILSALFNPMKAQEYGKPWTRHIINNSSVGADGVKLADANGDGLMDIVTGWEEGGTVTVLINPGPSKIDNEWLSVTVGNVGNIEDAVFVDLDGDGALDVVSSCEGKTKSMFIHWAPKDKNEYMNSSAWKTELIPAAKNIMQWMFCIPLKVDGKNGIDLIAGGKNDNAHIGWFESPQNPRDISEWKWHPVSKAGWTMSLFAVDMDNDGDLDIITTDRRGKMRGCRWLENPGPGPDKTYEWKNHFIGGNNREVMFMTLADMDNDKLLDILAAVKPRELMYFRRNAVHSDFWENFTIKMPKNTGTAKGINVGDINLDGKLDIVFSCENAEGKSGVMWMSYKQNVIDNTWDAHDISGTTGTKYDLVELLDLDGDRDLDVITCEERENLGVIWYENPLYKNGRTSSSK